METAALEVGRLYGFRQKRRAGDPLLKVKLLAKVGRAGKIKVRYEDGEHRGLAEYVSSRNLVISWSDRAAFLRDEERALALGAHTREHGDAVVAQAVNEVLDATGELWISVDKDGYCRLPREQLERILARADLEISIDKLHFLAFTDREGFVHLPLESAGTVARAFAAAEPEAVTRHIRGQEEALRAEGYEPGLRHQHDWLREQLPAFALAKQWCGAEQQHAELEEEIARLQSLVVRAAAQLDAAGAQDKAAALRRALSGG